MGKAKKKVAEKRSKSMVIGAYLHKYPKSDTALIVKALRKHGVTSGDVCNYRARHGKSQEVPVLASKTERIRDYLKKFPNVSNAVILEELRSFGVTAGDITSTKSRPKPVSIPRLQPFSIRLDVPACGAEIKLAGRRGQVICTLVVSETGVVIVKPNAKKPTKEISWNKLLALVDSGLLD